MMYKNWSLIKIGKNPESGLKRKKDFQREFEIVTSHFVPKNIVIFLQSMLKVGGM